MITTGTMLYVIDSRESLTEVQQYGGESLENLWVSLALYPECKKGVRLSFSDKTSMQDIPSHVTFCQQESKCHTQRIIRYWPEQAHYHLQAQMEK
jgi:hypothetical protein